ncbi:MAG: hypothetical protein HY320_00200 [Armatimonadetes bacterium]|nr:hypothetical protein [Armatimonadota bacterium]
MRVTLLLLAAALLLVGTAALTGCRARARDTGQAQAILLRALTDGQKVPYEGVKAARLRAPVGGTERARVLMAGDGRSRIEYLDGATAGVTVWDDGRRVWRAHPHEDLITVAPTARLDPALEQHRRDLVLRNFVPSLNGSERVAHRAAQIINLSPRHGGRPWKRLWVDAETGVVLASTDFNGAGQELRSTRFETFARPPAPPPPGDPRFTPPADLRRRARRQPHAGPLSAERLSRAVGFPVCMPAYLPAGFEPGGGYVASCPFCGKPTARMEFTDGLNTILLLSFAHRCPGEPSQPGDGAGGEDTVQRRVGNVTCVAVGELPRAELERILQSLPGDPSPRPPVAAGRS